MAAMLGILTTFAFLVFWASRAAQGVHHITDAVGQLANLPRKLRYQKRAGRCGLDLIEDPREAATVLMVATARLSGDGRVSMAENECIETIVRDDLTWSENDVDEFVHNIRWLTRGYKQPDTMLRPMVKALKTSVSNDEAKSLRDMMQRVAAIGDPTQAQIDLIRRYSDGMNLILQDFE